MTNRPGSRAGGISLRTISSGLAADEFEFYYQPIVSLTTGRLERAEALLRWSRPDGETILPDAFIPFAEAEGFIPNITSRMLPKLAADLTIISDINPSLSVSFNTSAQDFETPGLSGIILESVDRSLLDSHKLVAELTEPTVLRDDEKIHANITKLVDAGVALAMDDYGTGYSTISTLSRWPFSTLKLDRSLISGLATSTKCVRIVEASIRMAHQMDLDIVAEGIESLLAYEFLLRSGCHYAQGFWIGEPMPLHRFLHFLQREPRWSGMPSGLLHMAQLDHMHWRKSLIEVVSAIAFRECDSEGGDILRVPEMDHRACALGKWYYGAGQKFAGNETFDRLQAAHERFHQMGRKLYEIALNQGSRAQIMELMREHTEVSLEVLSLLQKLENTALTEPGYPGFFGEL